MAIWHIHAFFKFFYRFKKQKETICRQTIYKSHWYFYTSDLNPMAIIGPPHIILIYYSLGTVWYFGHKLRWPQYYRKGLFAFRFTILFSWCQVHRYLKYKTLDGSSLSLLNRNNVTSLKTSRPYRQGFRAGASTKLWYISKAHYFVSTSITWEIQRSSIYCFV